MAAARGTGRNAPVDMRRNAMRLLITAAACVLSVLVPTTARAVALGEPPIKQPPTPGVAPMDPVTR
ncbi:hypothetical protein GCM10017581_053940 [Dactylosporangium matsuzakiense]|uniref:Uncharacterized protein n=2 Tax=Dactylosporangium matsuzakiense TaxID=53360 RepID=A0A9W6KLZ9_9ACTN|nr:hypothetical protein GCM10017581_053940 [Dactylosporangium matsuzakiense]